MNTLDLFSGLEGWAKVARYRGHDAVTLDFDPRFKADHVIDFLTVDRLEDLQRHGTFDIIFASPPCEGFSTGSMRRHWGGGVRAYVPISDTARSGLALVKHTFALIDEYRDRNPNVRYIIENPRGVMRKVTPRRPTATTWYCQWGESRAKPTDLWTNVLIDYPSCHNGASDHDAQSRYYWKRKALGQTGGTQGLANAADRALIPPALAAAVIEHVENW